jgi:hypothetical protein
MRNGALSVGGSNWDLSRGAAASPARPLAEPAPAPAPAPAVPPPPALTRYAPDSGLAGREPVLVMTFARERAAVSRVERRALCQLPAGEYVVAGHAQADERAPRTLAQARARAVGRALRLCGLRVVHTTGYGAALAAPAGGALEQRRVEVFRAPR